MHHQRGRHGVPPVDRRHPHANFNPTWTRDGLNTPIWNRKNDKTGGFLVMQSKVGGTARRGGRPHRRGFHTWAHSCLTDGRIVVNSHAPEAGLGRVLADPQATGQSRSMNASNASWCPRARLHRASVSPSEKKICFEYPDGTQIHRTRTHALHRGFRCRSSARSRTSSRLPTRTASRFWFAYARWIDGEAAVVYHCTQTGKGQLYVYRLEDGSTKRVSTNPAPTTGIRTAKRLRAEAKAEAP